MAITEEQDYRPWLRRQLDAGAGAVGAFFRGIGGVVYHVFCELPILMVEDWWERFRTADRVMRTRNFLLGFPAFASIALAGYVGFEAVVSDPHTLYGKYHEQAIYFEEANDNETAMLLYKRMCNLEPDAPEARYKLAVQYGKMGKVEHAVAMMRTLASLGDGGLPTAHTWLAKHVMKSNFTRFAADLAREHLKRALELKPDDTEALGLLGDLEFRGGNWQAAEQCYKAAMERDPQWTFGLAKTYGRMRKLDDARRLAQTADTFYRERIAKNMDDRDSRQIAIEVAVFLADFPRAVQLASDGLALPGGEQFRSLLARAYVRWGLVLPTDQPAVWERRWKLLDKAFETEPANPEVVLALIRFATGNAQERSMLRSMLDRHRDVGPASVPAHLACAMLSMREQRPESAETLMKRAGEISKTAPSMLANMLHSATWTTDEAMALLNIGMKLWPDHPDLRMLRGELLAGGGQYAASLEDLQAVLPLQQDNLALHSLLADVYQRMGLAEESSKHRKLADPLRVKEWK